MIPGGGIAPIALCAGDADLRPAACPLSGAKGDHARWLSELLTCIEQSARLRGEAFCPIHAAGTSLTCHWCWALGIRETQADFFGQTCDLRCAALTSMPRSTSVGGHIRISRRICGRGGCRQPVGARPRITGTNKYGQASHDGLYRI